MSGPGVVVSGATPGYLGVNGERMRERLREWAASHGWGFSWGTEFDPSRPPAWSKIRFLQRLAPHHERLLWVDADVIATLKGPPPDEVFVEGEGAIVFASADENHLNTGVMGLDCGARGAGHGLGFGEAGALLKWVWEQTQYINHPWWEQAAFQEHHATWPADFRAIDKRVWNAYPGEEGPETALIHFPGGYKQRLASYAARYLGRSNCRTIISAP